MHLHETPVGEPRLVRRRVGRGHELGALGGVEHALELTGDVEQLLRRHLRRLGGEHLADRTGVGAHRGEAFAEVGAGHTS